MKRASRRTWPGSAAKVMRAELVHPHLIRQDGQRIVNKKELRQHLRHIMNDISPEELHERSLHACHRLIETPEYARAEIVMVFLSLPTEIDTTPLVLHAWRDHKRVVAPKVSWEQRRMLPIEIRSLSDDVSKSPLGIREPAQGVPIPVSGIDLIVVPGDDTIDVSGSSQSVTIYGGPGDDVITGSSAGDHLAGGSGDDTINAGGGLDLVFGDGGFNVDLQLERCR